MVCTSSVLPYVDGSCGYPYGSIYGTVGISVDRKPDAGRE